MTYSEELLALILLIHWLGDFALQTHEQAMAKNHDPLQLLYHVLTYILPWSIIAPIIFMHDLEAALQFIVITFVAHYVTDFLTSKISHHYFAKQDYHNGFVVVGFDQILHYVQLYLTIKWLYQ